MAPSLGSDGPRAKPDLSATLTPERDASTELIRGVCRLAGGADFLNGTTASSQSARLVEAVQRHDTPALYDWLMTHFSFQGISDRIAWNYIAAHGNATWQALEAATRQSTCACPRLGSFAAFAGGCGYRKAAQTCGQPAFYGDCPLPRLRLRKGDLNQLAFSLFYFLRDECQGDLVAYLDRLIPSDVEADIVLQRQTLLTALTRVYGVAEKVVAMTFAGLLITADPDRPAWRRVGESLIAIDTLVHNFLHRTGTLDAFGAPHRYGSACYGPKGCAAIVDAVAAAIDARAFNPEFPTYFPRFVQFAVWRFCAEERDNVCNGRRIDDRFSCTLVNCPVGDACARVALRTLPIPIPEDP